MFSTMITCLHTGTSINDKAKTYKDSGVAL